MKNAVLVGLTVIFLAVHGFAAKEKFDEGTLLDGFEVNDWKPASAEGTMIKLALIPGKSGKALQVAYDLKGLKQWVAILKGISVTNYDGKALQFYLRSGSEKVDNLEVKMIDQDGTVFGYKFPLKSSEQWQLITIPWGDFSYWWGGDSKLGGVAQFEFAISAGRGGDGIIVIDELKLVSSQEKAQKKIKSGIFDHCDSLEGWDWDGEEGTSSNLVKALGKEKDALLMEYDLGPGNWVQFNKFFPIELTNKSVFSFFLKWTGEQNNLEFKLVDKDGSNFAKKLENLEKKGEWQEVKIPVSELSYWWGGDSELDAKNIRGIWIGISRNKGNKGSIAIDTLSLK